MQLARLVVPLVFLLLGLSYLWGPGPPAPPIVDRDDCYIPESRLMQLGTCRDYEPSGLTVVWSDQDDEIAYRVVGNIHYYVRSCDPELSLLWLGSPEFDERLPRNREAFRFPEPDSPEANFVTEYEIRLEALGPGDRVLLTDGVYYIGEPAPCSASADIEEESG